MKVYNKKTNEYEEVPRGKIRFKRLVRVMSGAVGAFLLGFYAFGYFNNPFGNIITTLACGAIGSVIGFWFGYFIDFFGMGFSNFLDWLFEPK